MYLKQNRRLTARAGWMETLTVFCHLRQWRDERVPLLEEQCCLHLTQHLVQSALNLCPLQQTMQQTGQGCSLPLPAGLLTTSPTSRGGGVLSEEFARVVGEFSKSWLTRHSPALEKVTARMQSHQMDWKVKDHQDDNGKQGQPGTTAQPGKQKQECKLILTT